MNQKTENNDELVKKLEDLEVKLGELNNKIETLQNDQTLKMQDFDGKLVPYNL